jgi:acetyl-CoA carboxylase, biotin carboxylase subunit
MIANLICVGSSRASAIRRMTRALSEYLIGGIKTTIPFQLMIMQNPDFIRGDFDTSFIEKMGDLKALALK